MDKPMPLDVAMAQLNQAMADFTVSHDAAMACDKAAVQLNAGIALGALREIERTGMTDLGRRRLATAIKAVRSIMGLPECTDTGKGWKDIP